jgi:hypothetical protein
MSVTNAYCTVEEVRNHLGDSISKLDTGLIEKAVNAASRAIDGYCGRRFWQDPVAAARKYRPSRCDLLNVNDISTTTGLIVETTTSINWSSPVTWTLDTDFELGPDNADADGPSYAWWRLTAVGGKSFSRARFRSVRITAKWGWSQVPGDVNEACVLRAASLFTRKDAPFGVAGFSEFGAVRITRKDPDVVDLLARYQRPMAA